ncbi:hypothetical protein F5X99DRAFT_410826 [Biscogniauxia marginata]|nr:hypothetical protein F5X99DRAFT_410826 [Biscogniauxia marginata]
MGSGVLEDRVLDHVPGNQSSRQTVTSDIYDNSYLECGRPSLTSSQALLTFEMFKIEVLIAAELYLSYLTRNRPTTQSIPQIGHYWRRDLITFILSLTAIFAPALESIIAANTLTLPVWLGINFTYTTLLTGSFIPGMGIVGFYFVPSDQIWDKRQLLTLGTRMLITASAWPERSGTTIQVCFERVSSWALALLLSSV